MRTKCYLSQKKKKVSTYTNKYICSRYEKVFFKIFLFQFWEQEMLFPYGV